MTGVATLSPKRLNAAFMLLIAPSKLSPADWAAPPRCSRMAASKSSKDTLPSETIFWASSAVTWKWSARYCRTGMPASMSWSISSPWSLPVAATLPKMTPMSLNSTPAICAVSPTVLRTVCNWPPCLTPEATRPAATLAASPRPNAVPLTLASASFMMPSTLLVSWPRALSLVWARSMFSARSKPPLAARPTRAPPTAVVAAMPILPILPNAPPMRCRRVLLLFWVPALVPSPMLPSMALPSPLVDGLMMM